MELGLVVPPVGTPRGELRSWAVAAEDAGFDSIWVIDHLDSTPQDAAFWRPGRSFQPSPRLPGG